MLRQFNINRWTESHSYVMLLETLVWECVSSSYCGSRRLLPRGRSSPTTCCITALISMKATGTMNKRAQRKWFFLFVFRKKTLLGAGSTTESFMLPPLPPTRLRLLCSILFLLPIRLKRPRQKSADASFDSLLWQRSFSCPQHLRGS